MKIWILLFDQFETLDAFGPVEIFGQTEGIELHYGSIEGGTIMSRQNALIHTEKIPETIEGDAFLIPGGMGTRALVKDDVFLERLKRISDSAAYTLSVCTGSAVLAAAGVLDGKKATSNKKAFEWVSSINNRTEWIKCARWVCDDTTYTSSGVSAGIDMALGFISDLKGRKKAEEIAGHIEYIWNDNAENDAFCE